ncbi:amidohydrolase family protein [Moelleriella libera RCEF 2490]|uniref:Amidohydrolase family protein n=1 Tax=Moelleriella libera RCEF 2490 TaxID=1081109 RepID=A0A167WPW4_9HYPO|nr:amidohydrolase family protein [Moelleriella libera RCEF 2490]
MSSSDEKQQQQQPPQPLALPIIDAHVHLYPAAEADSLAWCAPDHPLRGERSVAEYTAASRTSPTSLLGFVLVESDRRHDLDAPDAASGWAAPLQEVRFFRRVALGDDDDDDAGKLCLGMIPWAPLPSGPAILERYLDCVREEVGEAAWPRVRGFRYLLQDKPAGTMTADAFVDGLKLLGRRGFVFEVAVDQHRRGKRQLDEVVDMIARAHEGVPEAERVTFVLNPSFHAWRTAMYALSSASRTYMKLSGGFSEMPASLRRQPASHIFQSTLGWLGIVLATFGPERIMFGSDWPVCTLGAAEEDEEEAAWPKWKDVVEKMCWMASLTDEQRAMIFGGTAKKAYGL